MSPGRKVSLKPFISLRLHINTMRSTQKQKQIEKKRTEKNETQAIDDNDIISKDCVICVRCADTENDIVITYVYICVLWNVKEHFKGIIPLLQGSFLN